MRVFVASNMPTDYPMKLQKPSTVAPGVRQTAETFILDSGIGDDVSNDELVALSEKYEPDYLVAKDELHDIDTSIENTLELLDREYVGEIMIPLQPDYVTHYNRLAERINADRYKYVLGGMAVPSVSTADAIKWIKRFSNHTDVYTHALGIGGGIEIVEALSGTGLVDSIDCSTPEQAAINGCVLDQRLRQKEVMSFAGGKGRKHRQYPLANFNSYQTRDVWEREANAQSELSGFVNE